MSWVPIGNLSPHFRVEQGFHSALQQLRSACAAQMLPDSLLQCKCRLGAKKPLNKYIFETDVLSPNIFIFDKMILIEEVSLPISS